MKKLCGLVVALVAVFSLTACGSSSSKYAFTCTGKVDGQEMTINGVASGDKVTKLVAESKTEASSAEEAKQGAALFNGFGSMAEESGMKMTAKASGKTVVMNITIDVEKAVKAAADSGSDTDDNALGIDLSKATKDAMVKAFEKQGLTCK